MATATKPTLIDGEYPSPKEIAEAWNKDKKDKKDNVRYFRKNQEWGIRTSEDDEIISLVSPGSE